MLVFIFHTSHHHSAASSADHTAWSEKGYTEEAILWHLFPGEVWEDWGGPLFTIEATAQGNTRCAQAAQRPHKHAKTQQFLKPTLHNIHRRRTKWTKMFLLLLELPVTNYFHIFAEISQWLSGRNKKNINKHGMATSIFKSPVVRKREIKWIVKQENI